MVGRSVAWDLLSFRNPFFLERSTLSLFLRIHPLHTAIFVRHFRFRSTICNLPYNLQSAITNTSLYPTSLTTLPRGSNLPPFILQIIPERAVQNGVVQAVVKGILDTPSRIKNEALLTPLLHLFGTAAGRSLVQHPPPLTPP